MAFIFLQRKKDKCQEKVFRLRPLGYAVTRGKMNGAQPSHKAMAGKVVDGERGPIQQKFFPFSITDPYGEQSEFQKKLLKSSPIVPSYSQVNQSWAPSWLPPQE